MTLREHCTRRQLLAHRILDDVAAGHPRTQARVVWALRVLGDLT